MAILVTVWGTTDVVQTCTFLLYPLGRGKSSYAYTHSVQMDHRVWLNLHSLKFYCLPDNYEIIDPSLEDIKVTYTHLHYTFVHVHVHVQ